MSPTDWLTTGRLATLGPGRHADAAGIQGEFHEEAPSVNRRPRPLRFAAPDSDVTDCVASQVRAPPRLTRVYTPDSARPP